MQTATESMKELFQNHIRFVIPRFQRHYVWTMEQWQPLWEDIVAAVDQCGDINDVPRHFLGAVVIGDLSAVAPDQHEVVDGQQRLTTLQLLFAALLVAASTHRPQDKRDAKISEIRLDQLRRLSRNDGPAVAGHPFAGADARFKVWPSRNDQAAYRTAMADRAVTKGRSEDPLLVQAYDYFAQSARAWLNLKRHDPAAVDKLLAVVHDGLYAVVIRLESGDDPQVIFERLNARQQSLKASDFVRNHLFALAVRANLNADWLYDQHWARFDEAYWEAMVNGRPRIDQFLSDFLVMETGQPVRANQVFARFAAYLADTKLSLEAVMTRIVEYGDAFRRLDTRTGFDATGREFIDHLQLMDLSSLTPVLLRLFVAFRPDERRPALRALDSYLVRRMIVDAPTNDYGAVAAHLAKALNSGERGPAERITTTLAGYTAKANVWPDDREVTLTVTNTKIAERLKSYRLRMVLKIIESGLRDPLNEPVNFEAGSLTVEHLMPVNWAPNWPRNGEDPTTRDHNVHTLGNLTLVSEELNKLLGNNGWSTKLPLLLEHSGLRLNRGLPEEWTVRALRERGRLLAVALCKALPAAPAPSSAAPTPPAPTSDEGQSGANDPDASTAQLEIHFDLQARRLPQELDEQLSFNANALWESVSRNGGVATARQLLSATTISGATQKALEHGRPDLTLEGLVLRPEFAPLFTADELTVAHEHLSRTAT